MKSFPALVQTARSREYNLYLPHQRAKVVYEYLFQERSHRWLDENILKLDFDGRGYQAMGILHHLGIVGAHKGFFKDFSLNEAVNFLESQTEAGITEIVQHLRLYQP